MLVHSALRYRFVHLFDASKKECIILSQLTCKNKSIIRWLYLDCNCGNCNVYEPDCNKTIIVSFCDNLTESRREACPSYPTWRTSRRSMEAVPAGTEELQWDDGGEEGGVWDAEIEGWEERQGDWDADEETTKNIRKCHRYRPASHIWKN